MKAPEPQLLTEAQRAPTPAPAAGLSRRGLGSWLLGAAVAAGLAAAAASGGAGLLGGASDAVSSGEQAQRLEGFNRAGRITLAVVDPREREKAVASMALPVDQGAQLRADVEAGRVRLGWVAVWDDRAEDGDVVELRAAGFSKVVPLLKAPTVLAVPIPPDGALHMVGVKDGGGGGITAAIQTSAGALSLPVLQAGQGVVVPVQ